MLANDDPAGTLRYEEKPVYTTSNGCPVNGSLHSIPCHSSLAVPMSGFLDFDKALFLTQTASTINLL